MAEYLHVSSEKMVLSDVESQPIKMKTMNETLIWDVVEASLKEKDHNEIEKLVKRKGFSPVWRPLNSPAKMTPLHKASEIGNLPCIKYLTEAALSNGFSIDSPDCDGHSSLFYAVRATQTESIKELLSANAQINARNDQGHSVLHVIAYTISGSKDMKKQEKLLECLDLLLDRPDIDLEARNNSGFTPLLSAAKKIPSDDGTRRTSHLVTYCRKLLSKGASLEACDKRGMSARQSFEDRNALPSVLMGERRPSPQRPFISQLLDSLLLDEDGEHISEQLSSQPQEEANRASNAYLGSQTVLFYVVDKGNCKAVEALLESGADSWKEQLSGEFCLHRALSRGNPEILNMLIANMKKKKNVRQLDMSGQSFTLLERLLENQKRSLNNTSDRDHLKCLKRMLQSDVVIDVNERSDEGVSQSILHVAASFNNQEAIKLLLERGAYIGARKNVVGDDRGNILPALRIETLRQAMDGCITHYPAADEMDGTENIISPDFTLSLDYRFLVPPAHSDSKEDPPDKNEIGTLMEISQCHEHRKAIKHPLIQTLLYAKWRKVLPLYLVNLSLYLTFVIFLTLFMYTLKDYRILEDQISRNPVANSTLDQEMKDKECKVTIYMGLLLPLTLYMLVREIFQIIYTFKTYLKNFENYLEWFLIIFVIILCSASLSVDATRHLAAWAMIIAWYEFVLLLGRAPPLAIYVTMLRHVSWNFLKLIFLYGALILAFSVSFNILLQPINLSEGAGTEFGNFWSTLPKAIVMATGEFEYSDLSSQVLTSRVIFATSFILVFLVFLFLIFLVLMNVMNGLAVTDTQAVMDEATLYSLKSRLELVYLIEEMLLVSPFLKKFLQKIHLISPPKNPRILVKTNYPDKSRRIIYGGRKQEFCKLDNDTANILRSYRLHLMSEEQDRVKGDPMAQCLGLLQEWKNSTNHNPQPRSPATVSPSSSRGRLN